jgi:hypothetical protein
MVCWLFAAKLLLAKALFNWDSTGFLFDKICAHRLTNFQPPAAPTHQKSQQKKKKKKIQANTSREVKRTKFGCRSYLILAARN